MGYQPLPDPYRPSADTTKPQITVGHVVIQVDIDELLEMMQTAAAEKGLELANMKDTEKLQLLKDMGYEEYLPILKAQVVEFSWLSVT